VIQVAPHHEALGDVVLAARPLELVQEPQPLLRVGERDPALRTRTEMKGPARWRRTPSVLVVKLGGVSMAAAPWVVSDELWSRIEPLLPRVERRFRYPGRKRLPDRRALQGILFVLYTGIAWRHLPSELGFGGGSTCHRRMDEWQRAGVWERLHEILLAELRAAGEIEWSRAVADSSHIQAKKGAPRRARARLTEPETAPSTTCS
jgi:transposase